MCRSFPCFGGLCPYRHVSHQRCVNWIYNAAYHLTHRSLLETVWLCISNKSPSPNLQRDVLPTQRSSSSWNLNCSQIPVSSFIFQICTFTAQFAILHFVIFIQAICIEKIHVLLFTQNNEYIWASDIRLNQPIYGNILTLICKSGQRKSSTSNTEHFML